jgi:hypothetical protein
MTIKMKFYDESVYLLSSKLIITLLFLDALQDHALSMIVKWLKIC